MQGLFKWRDFVARVKDDSTGYVLPNKSILEIAKQMPVTANNLRLLVNSRHPYVEHNLDSLVDIIRHSIQNTSAFEEIAQLLKTGHDVATIAQQLTRHPAQEHNRHPIRIGSQVMEGNFHKVLGSNIIHHWRRHGVVSHQLFDWQHVLVHFSTPVVQSCRYY
ncbi:hypothetical protein GLYMA_05G079550v4 [Glycine max]|nr:hypothetical protein GLYMA_05G079550v4 [Glycine max]KAH1133319.1 hypothetical protein GYH30_011945 [Glycine max]